MDKDREDTEAMPQQGLQSKAITPPVNPYHPDTNWTIVYHRIQYGNENGHACTCEVCNEYLADIEAKHYTQVA